MTDTDQSIIDTKWKTLDEVTTVNPSKPKYDGLTDDDVVGFVPMAAVDEVTGTVAAVEPRTLGELRKKSYRTFASGDVLFAKITPCMENGKSAVVPDLPNTQGFGSTEFHVLRPKAGTVARYIWHFLRQPSFRSEAEAHMTGSVGQLRVPVEFLRNTSLYVPDDDEQRRIVRHLDEMSDRSKRVGRLAESAQTKLAASRQAMIDEACFGSLTASWRDENPGLVVDAAPRLSAQGAKHASQAPNTDELTEIPDSWAWWTVESVATEVIDYRGRTPPSAATGPIPHVRTTQIRDGRIDWHTDRFVTQAVYDEYMTRGLPQVDDVLFTMEAPLGEVGVVDRTDPFSIAQRILLLRPAQDYDARFLAFALQTRPARRAIEFRATGSGVLGVAYKRFRSVRLPKPPVDEQIEIVRRLEAMLAMVDRADAKAQSTVKAVERAHHSAVRAAFSGALATPG